MEDRFLAVCENFKVQADYCKQMGSPFYADLLVELCELIDQDGAIGKAFSTWEGEPGHDAVALRFVAALHYLVITKRDDALQEIFPPSAKIVGSVRADVLRHLIREHENLIQDYLKSPPQTNEVGRSMVLLGGFLEVAKRFGQDMDIFEIGASAGLNMAFDKYYYQADSWHWGNPNSEVQLKPIWEGSPPPLGPISVHERKACDVSPVSAVTDKNRLLSYVWPDQFERINRIRGAIDLAAKANFKIDAMEATQWLRMQDNNSARIRSRVFYHSIIWQYFSEEQKIGFKAAMEMIGSQASHNAPVIWMRLEPAEKRQHAELKITIWPSQTEYILAVSGFHGEWVKWLGV